MDVPEAASAVSAATWALSYFVRRGPGTSLLWQKVPDRWRWLIPLALAAVLTGLEAYQSGRSTKQAAWVGAAAFFAAVGGHRVMKESPLPYGGKSEGDGGVQGVKP